MADHKSVSFKRPPVVETVLGVQFAPLPQFSNAYLGAFWKSIQVDWPYIAKDAPPIEHMQESFGNEQAWMPAGLHLNLSQNPVFRMRIQKASKDRMVQIQNGRLHYNWMKQDDGEYPRYKHVRPGFDDVLKSFTDFILAESLGEIKPNLWEVSYVNHLEKGTVWSKPTDWASLFHGIPLPSDNTEKKLAQLEGFAGKWRFEIPEKRGRLHVEVQHGRAESQNGPEILVMKLTARGPIDDKTDLNAGLDLGREVIVKTFADLTSKEAHSYWKREK